MRQGLAVVERAAADDWARYRFGLLGVEHLSNQSAATDKLVGALSITKHLQKLMEPMQSLTNALRALVICVPCTVHT